MIHVFCVRSVHFVCMFLQVFPPTHGVGGRASVFMTLRITHLNREQSSREARANAAACAFMSTCAWI